MDRKATLNGPARHDFSAHALAQKLAAVGHAIVSIAELQVRLAAVDLRAAKKAAVRSTAISISAAVLLAAALPTALIGLGMWVAEAAEISAGAGLLLVALVAAILASALGWLARRQMSSHKAIFERSTKELTANVAAIRQVLSDLAGRSVGD